MSKHIIILGHGEGDPGATGFYGKTERDYLEQLGFVINKLIVRHSLESQFDLISDINTIKRKSFINNTGRFKNAKSVTELHLNAFNSEARGAEVIFGVGLKPDAIDNSFKDYLSKIWKWRGFKTNDRLMNPREAKKRGINYRLVEYCFCDNKRDVDLFSLGLEDHARRTLECIVGYKLNAVEEIEDKTEHPFTTNYIIQLGAFNDINHAKKKLDEVKKNHPDAWVRRVK